MPSGWRKRRPLPPLRPQPLGSCPTAFQEELLEDEADDASLLTEEGALQDTLDSLAECLAGSVWHYRSRLLVSAVTRSRRRLFGPPVVRACRP